MLTSRNEGTPVALIEAMASGVPGVSTDVGGVKDVIDSPDVGARVPDGDAAGLAAHIVRYLADPDLRRQTGQRGRAAVLDRYSLDRLVRRHHRALSRPAGALALSFQLDAAAPHPHPDRLDRARSRGAVHRLSAAGLGRRMERSGRLPAARRRHGAEAASSRAFPNRRSSFPKSFARPAIPAFVAVIYRLFGEQHAAGRDRAGVGVRADLPDRLRDGRRDRRRTHRHRRGSHDGAVPATALLRRARVDRSVDDVRVGGWRCSSACAPSSAIVSRDFILAGVLFSATTHRAAGLRAVAVRTGDRDAAAGAVRAQPRPRIGQWAAFAVAAAITHGAVVHL